MTRLPPPPDARPPQGITRRSLLAGAGGLVVGAVAATAAGRAADGAPAPAPPRGHPVPAAGRHQAGIVSPATPQPHGLLAVHDLGDPTAPVDLPAVGALLAALGRRVLRLTGTQGPADESVTPDGPGDLTVTVGLGPRVLATVDGALPAARPMPSFARDDQIAPSRRGGDLLLALHATDPSVLAPVLTDLLTTADDVAPGLVRPRWAEQCFRAPGEGTVVRNPLGYLDGIRVPRTDAELADDVWVDRTDHPAAAGGTVMVLRRLVLDATRFAGESPERRDAVIGRHRVDGSPLSGGSRDDDVDLGAKTPTGEYLVPAHAHARAAHPSFTGSGLMLRRSYAFATPTTAADGGTAGIPDRRAVDQGMFFLSFQRTLDTFVRTQLRLDEVDDLMAYVTPTASASFLVLPGFDADRPLGASLFGTV